MNPFEMAVAIIFLVIAGKTMQAYLRTRAERHAPMAEEAETMRMRDEMRVLKDRVAVLERVITDNHNSIDLDREIQRLRDR